jgi:hypothetical protein
MNKIIIYLTLLFLLLSDHLTPEIKNLVFYVYLAVIYIESKDKNIKGLIFVLTLVEYLFYEINLLISFVTQYHIITGPIVGNIILDIMILIKMVTLIFAIFYRCVIFEFFTRLFKLKSFSYLPTRADILLIKAIKGITLIYITFFLANALGIYELSTSTDIATKNIIYSQLVENGSIFLQLKESICYIKYLIIVWVLNPWPTQNTKNDYFES